MALNYRSVVFKHQALIDIARGSLLRHRIEEATRELASRVMCARFGARASTQDH